MRKTEIRQQMRLTRKSLSASVVAQASLLVTEKIIHHPLFLNSQHIALYVSSENEIDPAIILNHARQLHKTLYLPVFSQHIIQFYAITANTVFKKNRFGIKEPMIDHQSAAASSDLNLILVPMVAFDAECHRLGRGAGCYDRYLQFTKHLSPNQRPALIGLAYEFQHVEKITSEEWDVSMDFVVTEECVYSNL